MKTYVVRAALVGVIVAACTQAVFAEVVDKIIVVVNTEVITQREVDKILEPIVAQYRNLYFGDELARKIDEARTGVLDQLVEDRLILSEAKKLSVPVEEREIDDRINEVIKKFQSKEAFEAALAGQGITVKDLRDRYREQIMVRKLVDQKVGGRVSISPGEVQDYYDRHMSEFTKPEEMTLSNIFIRLKPNLDEKQALATADELVKRLREGCEFAGLAREYSDGPNAAEGGAMGTVKRGDLLPELESVVFSLEAGQISDPVKTQNGFYIFKADERRPSRVLSLSDAKRDIEETIYRGKVRSKISGWVATLKKYAYIAYK